MFVFEGNINKSFQFFPNNSTDILINMCLSLKLSLKEMKSSKPCLSKGILKLINQKNAIYRKFIRTKNLHSKEIRGLVDSVVLLS